MSDTCRSCSADVVWAVMEASGKRMPLDSQPISIQDSPVLAARRDTGGQLVARSLGRCGTLGPGEHHARSHFASCANADQHRKSR